jgi:hypothetical protein
LLRDQDGLPLCQDQDTHGKADLLGAAGQKAEQHEWVVTGVRGGADAAAAVIGARIGPEHVVGRHQVSVAEPFCRLRIVAQYCRTGADIGQR